MTGLTVHSVGVTLGGARILDRLDLEFRRGEITAIVGPNGAGKSTLLEHLAGLRRPTAGEVRLEARAILDIPARERAKKIGFLPQFAEIAWAVDGETLVALGRTPYTGFGGASEADTDAVDRAIAAADVAMFRTRVVTTLSGGERGRVLIARALAGEPEWLLADEPMTGLDMAHQLDVADLLAAFAHKEGRGVVITLHDLTLTARIADRVVVMHEGQVVADGAPDKTLTPKVFAEVYGVNARLVRGKAGAHIEIAGRRKANGRKS